MMFEKMCQFLYLQEAVVNEDDFALFRVLGRGGFGMVNGCKKVRHTQMISIILRSGVI